MAAYSAWETYRYRIFVARQSLSTPAKMLLACLGALLIAALAQVRVQLPFTPVPVTGQTFAVFLVAVLLGRNWGGASVAAYAALGVAGVPWFAGSYVGLAALTGPTAGYIAGFVLSALFIGHLCDKYERIRTWWGLVVVMLIANFVIIHGLGAAWLAHVTGIHDPSKILMMGCLPFIPGDVVKVLLAAGMSYVMVPREGSW